MENLISFQPSAEERFVNLGEIRLQGMEAQWEQDLGHDWKLKPNLSYTDTLDRETGGRVPGAAKWLANAALDGRLTDQLRLGLCGDRVRWPEDGRSDLGAFHTIDLTLSWLEAGTRGLSLRTGVNNLFDEDVRALAADGTYVQDLPQPGRTLWAQVSYRLE